MNAQRLPVGSFVRLMKADFPSVLERLRELDYRVVGPRIQDGAIVYDDLESVSTCPSVTSTSRMAATIGCRNRPSPPSSTTSSGLSRSRVSSSRRGRPFSNRCATDGSWELTAPPPSAPQLAVIGVRSCDLHALAIQDRVFLGDEYVDTSYQARRENLMVIAVNCRRAAPTCFCHSMKTGPAVKSGFDLALTEMDDLFVVEVGSESGGHLIAGCDWSPCAMSDVNAAQEVPASLRRQMEERAHAKPADGAPRGRHLDTEGIKYLLLGNLEHERWEAVAERCLACSNCTHGLSHVLLQPRWKRSPT